MITERLRVRGQVQGVGFRPTVYRLAQQLMLKGEVLNDGKGVLILLQAEPAKIDLFIDHLHKQCPPLARIDEVERQVLAAGPAFGEFSIVASANNSIDTGIVADAATCPDCLDDINDTNNRRYGYAFTNCTHCGPRLSIIQNIPYDRATTSMASFTMCPSCQQEYDDPLDRRFHAQPNACPDCGPVLSLTDQHGNRILCQDPLQHCANLIRQGHIVAIKGIGGYQLACDAGNDETVSELRRRKHRPHKSFALMATDVGQVAEYCVVNQQEQTELGSHQAPIVILQRKAGAKGLSEHIAPGHNTLGFMLPYSPLHHLLMQQLDGPIVLTSGNAAEEPQCVDNQQALERLAGIADNFLQHNRDIVNRIDDSVVRVIADHTQIYRRARGYAPQPIRLGQGWNNNRKILACGGELKNTFCLLNHDQATLSQHMGNLENAQTYDDYLKNLELYQRLFQFTPQVIAVDKHPEYLSSKWGRQLAAERDLPVIEIQHHHAHIAACLADNQWSPQQGQVIGVALDGLGFGEDGSIWGGEFMLADYRDFQRLARFKPVAMPGATQAIVEPWRNLLAQLDGHLQWTEVSQSHRQLELFQYLADKPVETLRQMIKQQTNSPITSSCGRLFDAVAAAAGLCRDRISYEGQAAIELEALVDPQLLQTLSPYPFELEHNELIEINPAPMWTALLHDIEQRRSASYLASRFHLCLSRIIGTIVERISEQHGSKTVALSGGVFQNPTLLQLTVEELRQKQFDVLIHKHVPSNDGGLSLGQAAIAAVRTTEKL